MRSLVLAVVLATLHATPAAGQGGRTGADLSLGAAGARWRGALAVERRWPMLAGKVDLGAMVRVTAYGGETRRYTERGGDRGALPATIDVAPRVAGVNIAAAVEFPVIAALRVGMNLDLLGFGLGPARTAAGFSARPPVISSFRYGNADRGALNSEFYAAIPFTGRLTLRAGLSHYATGYRIEGTGGDLGHYQRFDDALFVALRLR